MDRKSFLKRLIGLTGLAVIAPSLLAKEKTVKCPLCLDTGEVVTHRRGMIGEHNFPDKTGPCPNCFPGSTSLIDVMRPLQEDYNRRMMKFQSEITDYDIHVQWTDEQKRIARALVKNYEGQSFTEFLSNFDA